MKRPSKRTIIALPPQEAGDLRAFACAIVRVARRLAQEDAARVVAEPSKKAA